MDVRCNKIASTEEVNGRPGPAISVPVSKELQSTTLSLNAEFNIGTLSERERGGERERERERASESGLLLRAGCFSEVKATFCTGLRALLRRILQGGGGE